MSKEKKMNKDEQLKFMKNQYSDMEGWFNRSLELLVNKHLNRKLVSNSKSFVFEKYSWRKLVKDLASEVYK